MRPALVLFAALLLVAPDIRAQATLPVDSRVRVTLQNGQQVTGRVGEVRGDTIVLIEDGLLRHPRVRLHADQLTRVDVSVAKQVSASRVIGGALMGALGGLIVKRLMPTPTALRCDADICFTDEKSNAPVLVGAGGGFVLGLLIPVDRWRAVPPPVRIGLYGDFRHTHFGVSLAF